MTDAEEAWRRVSVDGMTPRDAFLAGWRAQLDRMTTETHGLGYKRLVGPWVEVES